MTIQTFRKRPVVISAVQWDGTNLDEVEEFAGWDNFMKLEAADRARADDPEATASVYDKLHSTWVLVQTGEWIIRGVRDELYPCRDEVFVETYEVVHSG